MYMLPQWYLDSRKKINVNFNPENYKGVILKDLSPCGNYTFIVDQYQKTIKTVNYAYFSGTVYCHNKDVITIYSNAQDFWHCWIKKDKLYLLCNEDEQGYTVIDVEAGKAYTYIDPKAKSGWGFSWKSVELSEDGECLIVHGEYLEIKETVFFDFSNPTDLPLKRKKNCNALTSS